MVVANGCRHSPKRASHVGHRCAVEWSVFVHSSLEGSVEWSDGQWNQGYSGKGGSSGSTVDIGCLGIDSK